MCNCLHPLTRITDSIFLFIFVFCLQSASVWASTHQMNFRFNEVLNENCMSKESKQAEK
jgi:hypothetical protein